MAWCPDVLADKPHPWFATKILRKKVQLICQCLWYVIVSDFLWRFSALVQAETLYFLGFAPLPLMLVFALRFNSKRLSISWLLPLQLLSCSLTSLRGLLRQIWSVTRTSNNSNPKIETFKVAEHSFCTHFCWCNLACAQGFQKTIMPPIERLFYLLNTHTICAIFLHNWMQCIDEWF